MSALQSLVSSVKGAKFAVLQILIYFQREADDWKLASIDFGKNVCEVFRQQNLDSID
jgi:hypothetical protein